MSKGVRSRKLEKQIDEAYAKRDSQIEADYRIEVEQMLGSQTADLPPLVGVPAQRSIRAHHPSRPSTHRPIGGDYDSAARRHQRHRVIDLRDSVVARFELKPWLASRSVDELSFG